MPGIKREQGNLIEGSVNTRQDRNFFLTDGGTLTWDSGTGTLTWDGTLRVRIPGFTAQTIAPGSLATISAAHMVVYVDLNRAAGTIGSPAAILLSNAALMSDERVALAVRGIDGKLYFRNGSVFTNGDSKSFGSLNSATDRTEVIGDGTALQSVGFTFLPASGQLAVFVGGILQKLGLHYVETGTTQVTFAADYIPSTDELITFMNVIGGEGPPGSVSLQQAYDNGTTINVVDGSEVSMSSLAGTDSTILLRLGHASSSGGLNAVKITRDGQLTVNRIFIRDFTTGTKEFVLEVDVAGCLRIRSTNVGDEYGVKINDDDTGIEFGIFEDIDTPGETGGSVRTTTFTGTTSALVATDITTGFSTIRGVIVSVFHSSLGRYLVHGFADASSATREFYVSWTAAGVVTISGTSNGTGVLPAALQGQTCKVLVFH